MPNRIQPLEPDIPDEEPFANDKLKRVIPANALRNIVGSVVGPCVLAVDGAWGTGKTTFLKMWAQQMRNEDYTVVEFNAWETDFSEDPFLALISQIKDCLDRQDIELPEPRSNAFWRHAGRVLFFLSNTAVNAIPGISVDIEAALTDANPELITEISDRRQANYTEAARCIQEFRGALSKVFGDRSTPGCGPLVVIVDELDRCRPMYAIEVLETAKHLFSADGVVFVLGMNRSQLAHSIRCVYGQDVDADGYLARFVDIEFSLPPAPRDGFMQDLIERLKLDEAFKANSDTVSAQMIELLLSDAESISLRDAAQTVHRLALMMASCRWQASFASQLATALLVCRTLKPTAYRELVDYKRSDLEALEDLFDSPSLAVYRRDRSHYKTVAHFEAVIIAAFGKVTREFNVVKFTSPLYDKYQGAITTSTSHTSVGIELTRMQLVVETVNGFRLGPNALGDTSFNIPDIVEHIELCSLHFAAMSRP